MLQIHLSIGPISGDFDFFLLVEPVEFVGCGLNKIEQRIQIRHSSRRKCDQFGVDLLELTEMLLVERQLFAAEVLFGLDASIDPTVELLDLFVFPLVYVAFGFSGWKVCTIVGFLELFLRI